MDLMHKVTKPLENYISFEDFICQLSQDNNQPLYSVVSFLIHYDIQSVRSYYIFNYEIMPETSSINSYLREIQAILFMHNEDWIYEGNKSFEWLCFDVGSELRAYIKSCPYSFLKKSELLLFPPLMEEKLINFEIVDVPNTPFNDAIKANSLKIKQSDQERITELEAELAELKKKLDRQINQSADDLSKVPHQAYRALDRVMYAMAQLSNLDNSKPYSQNKPSLNASITTILQHDGLTLESEAVGKWLSRINNIKPLK